MRDPTTRTTEQVDNARLTAQNILSRNFRRDVSRRLRWWYRTSPPEAPAWPGIRLDLTGALLLNFELGHCKLDYADFTRAHFTGEAKFKDTQFTGEANFEGARFAGSVSFESAQFTRVGKTVGGRDGDGSLAIYVQPTFDAIAAATAALDPARQH